MLPSILSGFVAAIAVPWLHRLLGRFTGWVVALYCGTLFAFFASHIPSIAENRKVTESTDWAPSLGVSLSSSLDGLSVVFALLITGVGAIVFLYTGDYLRGHTEQGRLFAFLLMFMASMLGLVLSDNLLLLFIFWELTSISSYLLIGFNHSQENSRGAALQALLITGVGGLALLVGILLLAQVAGSYRISDILLQRSVVQSHGLYPAILSLLCLAGFTKSAQFPFHTWLPRAMAAPTPVSAYLHSATMVKAGVYLFARFYPVLGDTPLWHGLLGSVGFVTMLLGAILALGQYDLKRILAYSTISALGTLVLLLGVGGNEAISAMVAFLLVHSLYKGALFLVAGSVDHEAGSRDVRELRGLWRIMPITAVAAMLAAASMAGIPPLVGFLSKELLYEATWHAENYAVLFSVGAVVANGIILAVAGNVTLQPFFGSPLRSPKIPHEAPLPMWLGPLALAAMSGLGGLMLVFIGQSILTPAVSAIANNPFKVSLGYWHGFNAALYFSGATFLLGLVVYLSRGSISKLIPRFQPLRSIGPQRWYEVSLKGLTQLADWQTRVLQNGVLGLYLVTIILTLVALTVWALGNSSLEVNWFEWRDADLFSLLIAGLIVAAAALAVVTDSRLTAVAAMGGIGYGVSIVFLLFGAPDLAMTQFAIETLTVVVFLLAIQRLPRFAILSTTSQRMRDAFVAIAAGTSISALVLFATSTPHISRLAEFYGNESYPIAHGRNVVNVILVDFRGLDTLGEITVLAIAAIGVYGLLRLRIDKEEKP